MVTMAKPINFTPTDEDQEIIDRIRACLGVTTPGVLRVSLRAKAAELGVWAPALPADVESAGDDNREEKSA